MAFSPKKRRPPKRNPDSQHGAHVPHSSPHLTPTSRRDRTIQAVRLPRGRPRCAPRFERWGLLLFNARFLPGCRVLLYSSASLSAPPCPRVLSVTACSLAPSPVASIPSPPSGYKSSRPPWPDLASPPTSTTPSRSSSTSSSSVQYPLALWACLLEVCCFFAHSSTCCNNSLLRLGRRRREQDKPWHCADRAGSSEEGGVRCRQGTVLTGSPSLSIGRVPLSPAAAPATHRRPSPASSSRFLP